MERAQLVSEPRQQLAVPSARSAACRLQHHCRPPAAWRAARSSSCRYRPLRAIRAAAGDTYESAPPTAAAHSSSGGGSSSSGTAHAGLAEAKTRLLYAVGDTARGGDASRIQRGMIEEAQVAVEAYGAERELDFTQLEGRWLLRYTTARDVLPLVSPQRLPAPLQAGRIWQRFSSQEEGRVQNLIEALPPPQLPLAEGAALTLVVEAGWEVRTARSIALTFREAGFQGVRLSEGLQNLLASPLLPRGWWNQQALLAIRELSVRVPLAARLPGTTSEQARPRGINYMLTFLDEGMLIGRAQSSGGTYIFTRDDPPPEEEGQAEAP